MQRIFLLRCFLSRVVLGKNIFFKNQSGVNLRLAKNEKLIITRPVIQDTCAINDPIGQTHIHASSVHYSRLKFVLFCEILKSGDERKDIQTARTKIVITAGRDCGSTS